MQTVLDRWSSLMLNIHEAEVTPTLTKLYIECKEAKQKYLNTLDTLHLQELDLATLKLSAYLKGGN